MLRKAYDAVERKLIAFYCKMASSERGDTNFISIIIILGIVILLAAVFLGFKDTIVEKVQEIVDGIKFE